ncbi:MAG TPA: hypothetical protein VHL11_19390, partial [Phototrophicaceae bacterium]|nr:hypothetical protein [Phototrophicaceae bacterium]
AAREPGTGIADLAFVWSPDGSQILAEVNLYSPDLGRLMMIDVASQTRILIVDDVYCGYSPDWMPALSANDSENTESG